MEQKIYKQLVKVLQKANKQELTSQERNLLDEFYLWWEHVPMEHDELIREIKGAAMGITMEDAAEGFLYSISTGDYRYRTALSSLIWAHSLPEHVFEMRKRYDKKTECMFCGANVF